MKSGPAKPPFDGAHIDHGALAREAPVIVAAARRLLGYRNQLARLRAFKASSAKGARRGEADRLALSGARSALAASDSLVSASVSALRQANLDGGLDRFAARLNEQVTAAGEIAAIELWQGIATTPEPLAVLDRIGFDGELRDVFQELLESARIRCTSVGTRLIVVSEAHGQAGRAEIETGPEDTARTVRDLFTRGGFEAISAAIEAGSPAYLMNAGILDGARMGESMLAAMVTAQRDLVRHVRALEDRGLATYSGADPGSVLVGLMIAALVAFILGLVALGICAAGVDAACTVAEVLLILGAILCGAGLVVGVGAFFVDLSNIGGILTRMIFGPQPAQG
jgi:hypothetical protein